MSAPRSFLLAVIALYSAVFGALLWTSGGLPYVLDNNESFSSLWHAANLHNFGLDRSFGIADEAFAHHAAAHPYVHTHQGNFPRLFAYAIYVLGARSIESQIVVTTFTVGLAAMLLAYRFFASVVTPLFGFIACCVLITDYILVGQWQVVTYRVWHEFFVFSSALCVHACANRSRGWGLLTCLNFACLFYFELVFVAFVTTGVALYAMFILKRPRAVLSFLAWVCAGAALGLGTLLTQLWLLLGWEGLRRDLYLTFVARNQYLRSSDLEREMKEFFESRNIAFWYNLEDGSRFREFGHFIASLTHHEFQWHTPFFVSIAGIVVGGFLIGALLPMRSHPAAGTYVGRIDTGGEHASHISGPGARIVVAALILVGVHVLHKIWRGQLGLLLVPPIALMACLLAAWTARVLRTPAQAAARRWTERWVVGPRGRWLAFLLLVSALPSLATHVSVDSSVGGRYSTLFLAYAAIYGLAILLTLRKAVMLPDAVWAVRWLRRTFPAWAPPFAWLVSLIAFVTVVLFGEWAFGVKQRETPAPGELAWSVALAAMFFLLRARTFPVPDRLSHFRPGGADAGNLTSLRPPLFVFAASVGLFVSWKLYDPAYVPLWQDILAWASPGGIKYALLCLAVYIGAVLSISRASTFLRPREIEGLKNLGLFLSCGFAAYCVVYAISPGYVFTGYRFRLAPFSVFHTDTLFALAAFVLLAIARPVHASAAPAYGARTVRFAAGALLVLFGGYWCAMQLRYAYLLPPTQYDFLRRLEQPPFRGKSFVANNYAAPMAAATGQWAYLHTGLMQGTLPVVDGRHVIALDDTYLWLADKKSNPEYEKPDYFICVAAPSMSLLNEVLRWKARLVSKPGGCDDHIVVKLASTGRGSMVNPSVRLVDVDREGPAEVGFQRWAIVELLWDATQ